MRLGEKALALAVAHGYDEDTISEIRQTVNRLQQVADRLAALEPAGWSTLSHHRGTGKSNGIDAAYIRGASPENERVYIECRISGIGRFDFIAIAVADRPSHIPVLSNTTIGT